MTRTTARSASWVSAVVVALLAACAQQAPERTPTTAEPASGTLAGAYDRAKWEWVKNPDGRMLLKHKELAQCFLDPEPPMDLAEPGLRVTRGNKTIGAARYDVVTAYEGQDFWEAVYRRSGAARPVLGVYAAGRCQDEAEKILEAYEKRR